MNERPRSPFTIYSEALQKLEAEPGPLSPEKAHLMHFLRALITEYEPMHRLVSSPGHASNKKP